MVKEVVEHHLKPATGYIYGFCDLRGLLPEKYKEYGYGISIGKKLDDIIVDKLTEGPTLEYLEHYQSVNMSLAELTETIRSDLSALSIPSLPVVPTISLSSGQYNKYLKALSYDISHKMAATRAGLGWIGKTDLLVSFRFGPRLRLVTILLKDNPGNLGKPVETSRCGHCDICVTACPAKAANGIKWDIHTPRELFFDAFRCREMCALLSKQKLNSEERICGLCVSICPIGIRNHAEITPSGCMPDD